MTEQIEQPVTAADVLHEQWLVFRKHMPVGAYLPIGQLDGDCRECGGSWPCDAVMAVLQPLLASAVPVASPMPEERRPHLPVDCWCGKSRGTQ